jgi:cytochrome bd-type quinol oxidase subunit 2
MKATQNKSDVTNEFGDRDFTLAVCTCFLIPTVSKLFAIFVRYIMAEFHFRSMEASDIESDVTIQFLVGGLVIHFAGIFHLSCSVLSHG